MQELTKRIGQIIRKARLELRMTQEELAEKVDVTGKYIGMIERGEKNPSIQFLEKVAETLGISIVFLADSAGEKSAGISHKQKKLIRRIYEMQPDQVDAMSMVAETFGKYCADK